MRKQQLIHAAGLGLAIAAAALGLMFGAQIARYAHMTEALAQMEECQDLEDAGAAQVCVDDAYARLQMAKGGR